MSCPLITKKDLIIFRHHKLSNKFSTSTVEIFEPLRNSNPQTPSEHGTTYTKSCNEG